MAKVQFVYVQRKRAETGQTGTATYDLPEKGFIPEITVRAYSTPTASTDPALPLNKAITKIEVVDGATVIQSLTANQVMGAYMHRGPRHHVSTELNDNAVEGYEEFKLLLGGVIDGVNYSPDFAKFSNPQIKITWDYSLTTGPFGATFDADTSPVMKFSVIAKVVREGGKYTHGYVKSSQIYTWTQAASTTTQIEIPRGERLIGVMIEAGYDALLWTEDMAEIKFDFDNGAWVPVHLYTEDIAAAEDNWFNGPAQVDFCMDLKDAVEIDTHMGYIVHIDGTAKSSAGRSFEYDGTHKGVEAVGFMDVATPTAIATYELVDIHSVGYIPYQCFYIPCRELLDGDGDTIDTTAYSRIILECTSSASASTSSTPAIIAEYLILD